MNERHQRLAQILLASAKTDLLKRKYPTVPPQVIESIEQADPARGKSVEWMVRQVAKGVARWPEDSQRMVQALQSFYTIKRSPRLLQQYNFSPDLIRYTLHDLEDLDDKVRGVVQRPESLTENVGNKIYDDGIVAIVKPATAQEACSLSSGTKWCTSDPEVAQSYLDKNPLLVIYLKGKKQYQANLGDRVSEAQIMDLRDVPIKWTQETLPVAKALHTIGWSPLALLTASAGNFPPGRDISGFYSLAKSGDPTALWLLGESININPDPVEDIAQDHTLTLREKQSLLRKVTDERFLKETLDYLNDLQRYYGAYNKPE